MKSPLLPLALALAFVAPAFGQEAKPEAKPGDDPEAAYTKTITERADKIVATLGLSDANKSLRVRDLIAGHYRNLRAIHDPRDAAIKAARANAGTNKPAADAAVKAAQDEAAARVATVHADFLAALSRDLTQEQVDKVKDGLTYGVVDITYNVYLKMYPDLKDGQKAQIKSWLIEAREIAMDGSTSNEKHAVFGKYKGRINNYLSKAGYDAKQGEANLKH